MSFAPKKKHNVKYMKTVLFLINKLKDAQANYIIRNKSYNVIELELCHEIIRNPNHKS